MRRGGQVLEETFELREIAETPGGLGCYDFTRLRAMTPNAPRPTTINA